MKPLKNLFLLRPDVAYLNHGSYGACARPVFDAYQAWQRRLESQPVDFFSRKLFDELKHAREQLGLFINADPRNVAFVPNATFAVNAVARSLSLKPEDEVLATDHEYGACNNIWNYICGKKGAAYVCHPVPLPLVSKETFVDTLWRAVTPRTRVIFLSHITSGTAHHFPVEELCRRAREENILTIIDGAHALGQIDLDITAIDPDFYTSNAHKWLCTPKGAAFLYVRKEMQDLLEPLIIGWGIGNNSEFECETSYLNCYQWLGTDDPSAYLSVPAAIAFQKENNWPALRRECHAMLSSALEQLLKITGMPSMYLGDSFYHQMAIFQIPSITDDVPAFKRSFYDRYRIEIPFIKWNNKLFMRLSIQAYNSWEDVEKLLKAVNDIIKT